MRKSLIAFILLTLLGIVIDPAVAQENTSVLREVAQWKYEPQERVVTTFFSCAVVDCRKLGISGGFYKAYFPDGFVLTLDQSGKVIDSYYLVSENNRDAYRENLQHYRKIEVARLPERIKKRIALMMAHGDPLLPIMEKYLKKGHYQEALVELEKIIGGNKGKEAAPALGLRSIVYFLLGAHDKSLKDAEAAFSLDGEDIWAKRGASLSHLIKGREVDRALELLSPPAENMDRLLQSLVYAQTGALEKAAPIYAAIPDDFLNAENIFAKDLAKMVVHNLTPYLEAKKKECQNLEKAGRFKEALSKYVEVIKLADDEEAKKIRSHIASLFKAHPRLREMSEEARKHYVRSDIMSREGKHREAIEECRKALEMTPFNPELFKAIALNYAGLKQLKTAIYYMNIYLELYPEAPDARGAKDAIYRWEFILEKEGK